MRALIQRVTRAKVEVAGETICEIGDGMLTRTYKIVIR